MPSTAARSRPTANPFYLTSEERNVLYDADLSDNPKLAVIRDIFVFHCYIGCRVGDLYRLTWDNIKDGFLEYMPQKTKKCQAKTVRVPLARKGVEDTGTIRCQFRQTVPVQADTHLQPRHTGTAEALRHRPDGHHPRHARLQYRAKTLVRGGHAATRHARPSWATYTGRCPTQTLSPPCRGMWKAAGRSAATAR